MSASPPTQLGHPCHQDLPRRWVSFWIPNGNLINSLAVGIYYSVSFHLLRSVCPIIAELIHAISKVITLILLKPVPIVMQVSHPVSSRRALSDSNTGPFQATKTHRTFHLCGIPILPLLSDRHFTCYQCGYSVYLCGRQPFSAFRHCTDLV